MVKCTVIAISIASFCISSFMSALLITARFPAASASGRVDLRSSGLVCVGAPPPFTLFFLLPSLILFLRQRFSFFLEIRFAAKKRKRRGVWWKVSLVSSQSQVLLIPFFFLSTHSFRFSTLSFIIIFLFLQLVIFNNLKPI